MSDIEKELLDEIDKLQNIDYVKKLGSVLGGGNMQCRTADGVLAFQLCSRVDKEACQIDSTLGCSNMEERDAVAKVHFRTRVDEALRDRLHPLTDRHLQRRALGGHQVDVGTHLDQQTGHIGASTNGGVI